MLKLRIRLRLDLASKPLSAPHTKNPFQTGPEKAR
jgi:hypothetical protein